MTYALALVRSLLVARFLGPFLLGIFGFLTLTLQYLAYAGLGLQFAINVELATKPESDHRNSISASILFTALIGSVIVLSGILILTLGVQIFNKYSFYHFAPLVGVIAASTMLQQVYTNIFRVCGKLVEIAIAESAAVVVLIALASIFRGDTLIYALLIGMSASAVFAIILFALRMPIQFNWTLKRASVRTLLAIGLPLLMYNASFSLITMVAQSVVSIYYPLKTMGYYTFASGIANVALLGFSSIAWIAYPSILRRTRVGLPDEDVASVTDRANVVFGTAVFLLALAVTIMQPLIFLILPNYTGAGGAIGVLLLAQALLQSSFGFNCLAIARQKQLTVARVSFISVVLVGAFSLFAAKAGLPFIWVAIGVLLGGIFFSLFQARTGLVLLGTGTKIRPIINAGTYLSLALCLGGILLGHPSIGAVAASGAYLSTNRARVWEVGHLCKPYLRNLSWICQRRVIQVGGES